MKKFLPYILSGLISVTIIFVTGWVAFYSHTSITILHEICFYFHLLPFGIGFTGGSELSSILYYLALWSIITLILIPIIKAILSSKNRGKILITFISIITIGIIALTFIDRSIKTQREERISRNKEEDKKNFNYLRTGDLIFQTPIDSDSMDPKMAIIDVDDEGYTVLEITDRFHHEYASLRLWIEEHGNYTIKRLINTNSILTKVGVEKFHEEYGNYWLKSYSNYNSTSDDNIPGSELICALYKRALNVELVTQKDSTNSNKNRTEQENSLDNSFISNLDLFNSDKLITVMKK